MKPLNSSLSVKHLAAGSLRALLLIAALAPWAAAGCGGEPAVPRIEDVQLSILAVGDTGRQHALDDEMSGQDIVARGLVHEDKRAPADAMLLLGDNFYERGLRADEMVERLKENLVNPYCRFVALDGPDSARVAEACRLPAKERHSIPILAVLGNHDHYEPGSAKRETKVIPRYVTNWHMPQGPVQAFTLGHGVSLVLFDSEVLARGEHIDTLRDALRDVPGPWRVLVGHRPLRRHPRFETSAGGYPDRYIESVTQAISEARVPVQMIISGHEHNLQILEMAPPAPPLSVIAGSGSSARGIDDADPRRLLGIEKLGFVRLDLVTPLAENSASLVVSVFEIDRHGGMSSALPRLAARWAVNTDGHVRRIFLSRAVELNGG
ncbi:MAG: metallophosphoesterase [Myxococcota bacterium]